MSPLIIFGIFIIGIFLLDIFIDIKDRKYFLASVSIIKLLSMTFYILIPYIYFRNIELLIFQ